MKRPHYILRYKMLSTCGGTDIKNPPIVKRSHNKYQIITLRSHHIWPLIKTLNCLINS